MSAPPTRKRSARQRTLRCARNGSNSTAPKSARISPDKLNTGRFGLFGKFLHFSGSERIECATERFFRILVGIRETMTAFS